MCNHDKTAFLMGLQQNMKYLILVANDKYVEIEHKYKQKAEMVVDLNTNIIQMQETFTSINEILR